jgi:hypothetical protein
MYRHVQAWQDSYPWHCMTSAGGLKACGPHARTVGSGHKTTTSPFIITHVDHNDKMQDVCSAEK